MIWMHFSWLLRTHVCICGQCKRVASESQLFRTCERHYSWGVCLFQLFQRDPEARFLENTRKWKGLICWYFKPNMRRSELITCPCKPVPHPVISSCTASVSRPSQKPGITLNSLLSHNTSQISTMSCRLPNLPISAHYLPHCLSWSEATITSHLDCCEASRVLPPPLHFTPAARRPF